MRSDDFNDYEELAGIAHDLAEVNVLDEHNGVCPFCNGLTYNGRGRDGLPGLVEAHAPTCQIGRAKAWRASNITSI